MPVYFIQAGDSGPVKIGHAKDVRRRLAFLKTASAEPLRLRAEYEGGAAEERALHRRFADVRVNLEWFAASVLEEEINLPVIAPRKRNGRYLNVWTAESYRKFNASRRATALKPEFQERRRAVERRTGSVISMRSCLAHVERLVGEWDDSECGEGAPRALQIKRDLVRYYEKMRGVVGRTPELWSYAAENADRSYICRDLLADAERLRLFLRNRDVRAS